MLQDAFWVGQETVIQTDQVIATCSHRLRWIHSFVEVVLKDAVLSQADSFEGEAQEEEESTEDADNDDTSNDYFPPIFHLNY